ncbi:hypothetical protein MYCTH_107458 [Thermothelomyces thermophilus ATCC 42464]|uniref:Uncharacterized protein n=1 Tax=Thermothelomyces thermophilus (strain ATCC 42464 / BCRC 31852 / DSM 1799) TaxID=573729 RepID=G2QBR1_THET4|nr:uncharacterized protein MYCTH_107458 [Thermothelomyces thermophilus ATCC 42464]AEO58004.1 hypothetical protein MYCTH_107458 [Thermothelomyces thermophilus ATCC 42464]
MAPRRSARQQAKKAEKEAVIEILSSDSEPETPEVKDDAPGSAPASETGDDVNGQPLLRAASIKYKADNTAEESQRQDDPHSPSSPKSAVRSNDTGSAKRSHVSIEIPLPTSSALRRRKAGASASGSQEGDSEDVFKTPKERKQHITFEDSDHDEFVTPREGPSRDSLEDSIAKTGGNGAETGEREEEEKEEEEEDDSDDDAPPEAVSTRDAEAETLKAAEAAAKAIEQQAAALKRKRQERDAFLKRQAEERKRAQKASRQEDEDEDANLGGGQDFPPETEKRKREVPKLLPLDLLESDGEDDAPRPPSPATNAQHKRRKLGGAEQTLLREPKLPKDKRLGSTAYRVVKSSGDTRLAPKVKKQAVNLKETLLRRDRVAKPRGGFFVRSR